MTPKPGRAVHRGSSGKLMPHENCSPVSGAVRGHTHSPWFSKASLEPQEHWLWSQGAGTPPFSHRLTLTPLFILSLGLRFHR